MSESTDRVGKGTDTDVVLIGAGIISSTLSTLLKELQPDWDQVILERLDIPAGESSSPWNNAGTGHSALCELNYTQEVNGDIDITKAVSVNEKFQISRQFWSYLIEENKLGNPREFINKCPHMSFGHSGEQVRFLRKRFDVLSKHPLFPGMHFTDDNEKFAEKLPLMARGRDYTEPVAISWTNEGTDINFGALKNLHTGDTSVITTNFVFVGAGGMALPLLQKAGIPEIKGYGGFPVSGEWLRCTNEDLIKQHAAKVYGKASVGAPPMSVPHLDTRIIDGKRGLLFGPYAGWTPKFLKKGSFLDLPKSLRPGNIASLVGVGLQEFGLTRYLVEEVLKNQTARVESLREYMPSARAEDWELVTAGQRVQVIKPIGAPKFGSLEFGTAVISSNDGSIAGLMGASPGASIAPSAMIELLERCFGSKMIEWAPKIKEMVPSYGKLMSRHTDLFHEQWDRSQKALQLES